RQVLVHPWIDRQRRVRGHFDRVAVRRRLLERLEADGAVGAAAVLNDDGLVQPLLQELRDNTRDHVGAAAGWVGNEQSDRLFLWPILRKRGRRCEREQPERDGKYGT